MDRLYANTSCVSLDKMKFLSFLIFFGSLVAKEDPLFVSLGSFCEVAGQLRNHNMRKEAYPFDWMVTLNHEKFLKLLDDDFRFFLDQNYFFRKPDCPGILENSYYECEFRHDPPENPADSLSCHLERIASKYERRIARFRKLKEYTGKVFFIRSADDITMNQAKSLKMALDRFFPLLDYTLVIVHSSQDNFDKIVNHDDIIEFKIRKNRETQSYAILLHRLSHPDDFDIESKRFAR